MVIRIWYGSVKWKLQETWKMKFFVFYLQFINSLEGLGMFFSSAALICRLHRYTATLDILHLEQWLQEYSIVDALQSFILLFNSCWCSWKNFAGSLSKITQQNKIVAPSFGLVAQTFGACLWVLHKCSDGATLFPMKIAFFLISSQIGLDVSLSSAWHDTCRLVCAMIKESHPLSHS